MLLQAYEVKEGRNSAISMSRVHIERERGCLVVNVHATTWKPHPRLQCP